MMEDRSTGYIALVGGLVVVGVITWFTISNLRNNAAKEKEKDRKDRERRNYIYGKYGPGEIADKILRGTIWVGETAEQVRDSLGSPVDVDQKILKTKRKEIWKYNQSGQNRYGVRITLDNDVVVGWDVKD